MKLARLFFISCISFVGVTGILAGNGTLSFVGQGFLISSAQAAAVVPDDFSESTDRELRQLERQVQRDQRDVARAQRNAERDRNRAVKQLQRELRAQERDVRRSVKALDREDRSLDRGHVRSLNRLERQLARDERSATKRVRQLERQLGIQSFINRLLRRNPSRLEGLQQELASERILAEERIAVLRAAHDQAVTSAQALHVQQLNDIAQRRLVIDGQLAEYRTGYQIGVERLDQELADILVGLNQEMQGLESNLQRIRDERERRLNPPPPCVVNWICSDWSVCSLDGVQTRQCQDANSCDTTVGRPALSQSCTFVAPTSTEPVVTPTPTTTTQTTQPIVTPPTVEVAPTPTPTSTEPVVTPTPPPVVDDPTNITLACDGNGREVPFAQILDRLGITNERIAYTPITEANMVQWVSSDADDPSGDQADVLQGMARLQSACTQGSLAYIGVDAIEQVKYLTDLGWPIELALGFEEAANPINQSINHTVLAVGTVGPTATGAYTITAIDPNGPQVTTITCSPSTTNSYLCNYLGADGTTASAVPAIRSEAEALLTGLRQLYTQMCNANIAELSTLCARRPVAAWLTTNFPAVPNITVTGTTLTGGCSGWIDFVSRIAFLGDFVGECATQFSVDPTNGLTGSIPEPQETQQDNVMPDTTTEPLPLPPTASENFVAECPGVSSDEEVCRVWPLGCSENSATCCEACQYDGADPGQCRGISPKNYDLICECPGGEKETMFSRRDAFVRNPDCSVTVETYVITQCQTTGTNTLACPCAGATNVVCTGSETIPARTCTIDAFGNRYGDCEQLPARITNPSQVNQFNLKPNEAAYSFAEGGLVLGVSTFDSQVPLPSFNLLGWIWDQFLYFIGK